MSLVEVVSRLVVGFSHGLPKVGCLAMVIQEPTLNPAVLKTVHWIVMLVHGAGGSRALDHVEEARKHENGVLTEMLFTVE